MYKLSLEQFVIQFRNHINMNNFVITAVLAIFLSCQTEALNLFAGMTGLKNDVKSTSSEIERYGNKIVSNSKSKLMDYQFDQVRNFDSAINSALKEIRNDIIAAKKNGTNADHCYEPSIMQLSNASEIAWTALDKCVDNAVEPLKPVVNNINSHVTNGQLLLSKLDDIVLNCASSLITAQSCLALQMPTARGLVNSYKSTANELQITGDSISNSAPVSMMGCSLGQPTSDLYSAVSLARISAAKCIKNV